MFWYDISDALRRHLYDHDGVYLLLGMGPDCTDLEVLHGPAPA